MDQYYSTLLRSCRTSESIRDASSVGGMASRSGFAPLAGNRIASRKHRMRNFTPDFTTSSLKCCQELWKSTSPVSIFQSRIRERRSRLQRFSDVSITSSAEDRDDFSLIETEQESRQLLSRSESVSSTSSTWTWETCSSSEEGPDVKFFPCPSHSSHKRGDDGQHGDEVDGVARWGRLMLRSIRPRAKRTQSTQHGAAKKLATVNNLSNSNSWPLLPRLKGGDSCVPKNLRRLTTNECAGSRATASLELVNFDKERKDESRRMPLMAEDRFDVTNVAERSSNDEIEYQTGNSVEKFQSGDLLSDDTDNMEVTPCSWLQGGSICSDIQDISDLRGLSNPLADPLIACSFSDIFVKTKNRNMSFSHIYVVNHSKYIWDFRTETKKKVSQVLQTCANELAKRVDSLIGKSRNSLPPQMVGCRDFRPTTTIGSGSFGSVVLAENLNHPNCIRSTVHSLMKFADAHDRDSLKIQAKKSGIPRFVAIKCVAKSAVHAVEDFEALLLEREVLRLGSSNPFICRMFCTFQTGSHLFYVLEYLSGGDLMFHVQQEGRFPVARARFYAAQICLGLEFLHDLDLVYRSSPFLEYFRIVTHSEEYSSSYSDLKLDNVLLDQHGNIRLADFGMCRNVKDIVSPSLAETHLCGTPDYMAPERTTKISIRKSIFAHENQLILGEHYGLAVDWWALGVLIFEMVTARSPFTGSSESALFEAICYKPLKLPSSLKSNETGSILLSLLEKEPGKRLKGNKVVQHRFFDPIDFERLSRLELDTPFKPQLSGQNDVSNFDREFTSSQVGLTIDPNAPQLPSKLFKGFSTMNVGPFNHDS